MMYLITSTTMCLFSCNNSICKSLRTFTKLSKWNCHQMKIIWTSRCEISAPSYMVNSLKKRLDYRKMPAFQSPTRQPKTAHNSRVLTPKKAQGINNSQPKWCLRKIRGLKFSNREATQLFHLLLLVACKWIIRSSLGTTECKELWKRTLILTLCRLQLSQTRWSKHNNRILQQPFKIRPCKLWTVPMTQKAWWIRHSKLKWTAPLRMDSASWSLQTTSTL